MTRCKVAALADLEPGALLRVDAGDVPVCLARLESGEVHAISDICSHEQVELSDGDLQGTEVECPAHSSRFNVLTGDADGFPAEKPVPVYPVVLDGDDIYVEV